MHEFLPAAEGVIAVRYRGKLSRADMEASIDRIETSLDVREKTHIYMEFDDFSGFETEGMTDHMKRGGAMLGKLDRFGRIAVVADQDWLRWMAKVESALIPKVSYETFTSDEHDRALAWVEGRQPLPHRPAFKLIETDRPDVHGFELNGKLSAAEIEAAADHFSRLIDAGGKLSILGRIKDFGGVEFSGLTGEWWRMKRGLLDRLDRYAVVGGPAWIRTSVQTLGPLFKPEVRHFDASEEEAAWIWLGAQIRSERTLVD